MNPFSILGIRSTGDHGRPSVDKVPVIPFLKDSSTIQTISQMISIAKESKDLPQFRQMGRDALSDNDGKTLPILEWVQAITQGYLSFQTDDRSTALVGLPYDVQLLLTPPLVLANPGIKGACASYSTFGATLLLATNLPIDLYFTTIAADPEDPNEFSHVYITVVDVDGNRIALDCSHGKHVGWEYPKWNRKHNWLISKATNYPSIAGDEVMNSYNNLQEVRGLGDLGELGNVDWGGLLAGAESIGQTVAYNETVPTTTYKVQNADGSFSTYNSPVAGVGMPSSSLLSTGGLNLGSISPVVLLLGAGLLFMMMRKPS